MRELHIVWKWFQTTSERLCNDLEPVLAPCGASKVVISLKTSLKNALFKKRAAKAIPWGLWDSYCSSSDLQEGLKMGPQSHHQSVCCAQNTVNNQVFEWFYYFEVLFPVPYYQDQSLNTYRSKQALWVVSGTFWGCNEPPKVVILLRTSFQNRLLTQYASKASSKALLKGFLTAARLQSEAQPVPRASHEPSCCFFWSF